MKNKKIVVFLLLIICIGIAFVTRFYLLGKAPHGFYIDEAGQGYSAYSILKTGKDEFGKSFPIVFRSFIDFKTPVYIYLIVPLIPIFGLSSFTVRFPSFLFSIFTFPILYLLLKELINHELDKVEAKKIYWLPLIASFLLAISPWHILFGRTNFECNVALFFFLTGVYLFYKGLKNPKWLILCAFSFAIAIPAYHSQRLITPLMMLALFIRHRGTLLQPYFRKFIIVGLIIGFIISLPTLKVATTSGFLARAAGLNIFSVGKNLPSGYLSDYHGVFEKIVNNTTFLSIKEFSALYVSYFSPRNMFILGDYGPRSSFPELSTFFLWQFPFYILGLYIFIKEKKLKEFKFFILYLLLISPLPAAVTRDPYSTIRALPLVIPQIVIVAYAITKIYSLLNKNYLKIGFYLFMVSITIYSLLKLYSSVIILNEYYRARSWDYGWQEVVEVLNSTDKNLPIIVDNARYEPYSQLIFFLKYDPATYQKDNFEVSLDEYYTNMNRDVIKKIGNITTRQIDWEKDLYLEQYLVGDELAISKDQIKRGHLTLIKEILYPDQSYAFRIVKTNPSLMENYLVPEKR